MSGDKVNPQIWDDKEVKTKKHDDLVLYCMENAIEIFAEPMKNQKIKDQVKIDIKELKTEIPVMAGSNKFIVGYLDLYFNFYFYRMIPHKHTYSCDGCGLKEEKEGSYLTFAIEVKPKVENFGDLIRQINKYKEYMQANYWIIYTKSCNEQIKKALATQKIYVKIHK